MAHVRRMAARLLLLAAGSVLLPVSAVAQFSLSKALWDENVSLSAGNESVSFEGADPYAPEPHAEALSGIGYDLDGSVAFGPPGPPQGTLMLAWDITEIGPSVQLAAAIAIDFQFRIVETASPPAGVTGVPVHVAATGSASAHGGVFPVANSVFRFQVIGAGVLITDRVDVDDNPGTESPASDTFTIDETTEIPLDAITLVSMSTASSAGMVASGEARTGSTTGMIDPVIEIVDDPIPGSSGSYRDYFSIEFSEGYDAQTTPVKRITLGELKRLYRERR